MSKFIDLKYNKSMKDVSINIDHITSYERAKNNTAIIYTPTKKYKIYFSYDAVEQTVLNAQKKPSNN